jgi:hypothetical protein
VNYTFLSLCRTGTDAHRCDGERLNASPGGCPGYDSRRYVKTASTRRWSSPAERARASRGSIRRASRRSWVRGTSSPLSPGLSDFRPSTRHHHPDRCLTHRPGSATDDGAVVGGTPDVEAAGEPPRGPGAPVVPTQPERSRPRRRRLPPEHAASRSVSRSRPRPRRRPRTSEWPAAHARRNGRAWLTSVWTRVSRISNRRDPDSVVGVDHRERRDLRPHVRAPRRACLRRRWVSGAPRLPPSGFVHRACRTHARGAHAPFQG